MDITIRELFFSYVNGDKILNGINLKISEGEQVALIGQNGSGKSTLVRHLIGLLKPSCGSVKVGSWLTNDYSPAQLSQKVGLIFQNPDEQLCKTTVQKEVEFGVSLRDGSSGEIKNRVESVMKYWGLEKYADVNPHDLSPTWRRRVIFASILAMDTPIVILDEPTTGQDELFKRQLVQLMIELKKQNKTVITISHDMDFVAEQFERVLVLQNGEIVMDGTPEKVFEKKDLLKSSYLIPPQVTRLGARLGMNKTICHVEDFINSYLPVQR